MRFDCNKGPCPPIPCKVVDADGVELPHQCITACDDETGEYEYVVIEHIGWHKATASAKPPLRFLAIDADVPHIRAGNGAS